MADITQEQVREFLVAKRAKVRPSTANQSLTHAKVFFGRFKGSLRKNPTDGIPRYKEDGTEVDRKAFTPEQIRTIVSGASPFWRCAAAVAFYTGLRLSDVARLRVKHVDFAGGKITVAQTVKTHAPVSVPIPAGLLTMLREQIKRGAQPDDFIWPDQAALDSAALSDQFGDLLVQVGIRKELPGAGNGVNGRRNLYALTFHSLRHSFITALANAGVNQQTVKKLVGHASTTVNDAYTHIGQETLDSAAKMLPDITVK